MACSCRSFVSISAGQFLSKTIHFPPAANKALFPPHSQAQPQFLKLQPRRSLASTARLGRKFESKNILTSNLTHTLFPFSKRVSKVCDNNANDSSYCRIPQISHALPYSPGNIIKYPRSKARCTLSL